MKYFQQVLIMVAVMTQAGWVWAAQAGLRVSPLVGEGSENPCLR
jgi:hypothetical protein